MTPLSPLSPASIAQTTTPAQPAATCSTCLICWTHRCSGSAQPRPWTTTCASRYELCVYLLAVLPRKADSQLDAGALERWRRYLTGYRSVRPVTSVDFDAIATFVVVRQFWLLGEYASRLAVWGTQALSTTWLREHAGLLTAWESLTTPQ
jgi:hypothetical protein